MTSDSRNESGGMTGHIDRAFNVGFGLKMVGQPFVEGMCVSSCTTQTEIYDRTWCGYIEVLGQTDEGN
jgi:hypothetical protein